ncbi:MAG: PQQ-binding-like beta-propeller repeat protein [Halobaculum sp.]
MSPRRRRVLAGVGTAATAGTALLDQTWFAEQATFEPRTAGWTTLGGGPGRRRHAPDASPPTAEATRRWAVTPPTEVDRTRLAVADGAAYLLDRGGVTAFDAADGTRLWRVAGRPNTTVPVPTVVAAGDTVIVPAGDRTLGVDAERGTTRWVRTAPERFGSSVVVGGTLVGRGENAMVAVATETGYRHERLGPRAVPVAFADGRLFACPDDERIAAYDRRGERLWRTRVDAKFGTPDGVAATGDRIVVGANPAVALDAADGNERWRREVPETDETFTARPATDGDRVYLDVPSADESVVLDAATGAVVWRADRSLGTPTVAGDVVYWAGDWITVTRATTGERVGRFGGDTGDPFSVVAAVGDRLYAARHGGPDRPALVAWGEP